MPLKYLLAITNDCISNKTFPGELDLADAITFFKKLDPKIIVILK